MIRQIEVEDRYIFFCEHPSNPTHLLFSREEYTIVLGNARGKGHEFIIGVKKMYILIIVDIVLLVDNPTKREKVTFYGEDVHRF